MAILSPCPKLQFFNDNGIPLTGGKLFTYQTGTTTKKTTYTDSLQNSANTNPIVLNSRGECSIYLQPSISYKFVLSPSTDTDPPTNPIWTVDPINSILQLSTVSQKSGSYTVVVTDDNGLLNVSASGAGRTITLPTAASMGNGFQLTIKKSDSSSNTVTIAPNGAETIDGSTSWVMSLQYSSLTLVSDGSSSWLVKNRQRDLRDNGNYQSIVSLQGASSTPVNYLSAINAGTGSPSSLTATGSDANVSLFLAPKGTSGTVNLVNSNGSVILQASSPGGSIVNFLTISNALTGVRPSLTAGGDTNVGMLLSGSGNGAIRCYNPGGITPIVLAASSTTNVISVQIPTITSARILTLPDNDVNLTNGSFYAYDSGGTTVNTGTATKLGMATELYDTNSWFASGTYTPLVAGKYLISAAVQFTTMNAAGTVQCMIYKNGTVYSAGATRCTAANVQVGAVVTALVDMNGSTDYIELYANQDGGGNEAATNTQSTSFICGYHIPS